MEVVWIEETPKTIAPQKTIRKKRRKVQKVVETWQTLVTQMSFTEEPGQLAQSLVPSARISKMDIRYLLN